MNRHGIHMVSGGKKKNGKKKKEKRKINGRTWLETSTTTVPR
jgi:hypothetical protein